MKPGKIALREYEYIRHGTLSLIAAKHLGTGKILPPLIRKTRNEKDFLEFIQKTVATDPNKKWIFIADQLNTHMSASLVEWIAKKAGLKSELGKKGMRGILKNKVSRKQFLEKESHSIRFVYTPRHCSWMNQIEVWFGQLQSQALTRGSFTSTKDLRKRLLAYIRYYNDCLAKTYKWKYKGGEISRLLNA